MGVFGQLTLTAQFPPSDNDAALLCKALGIIIRSEALTVSSARLPGGSLFSGLLTLLSEWSVSKKRLWCFKAAAAAL